LLPRRALTLIAAVLCAASAPRAVADAGAAQGWKLVELAAAILACEVRPCLGDSVKEVREAVRDAIVTDGIFHYSDLTTAYPSVRGSLQGVVEWDLDGGLDAISMKLTGFHARPDTFLADLERALPGCRIEMESDDEDDVGVDDIPGAEASCLVTDPRGEDVNIDAYFAPGLLIFELYD
jgi:hypothetical protein